MWTHSGSPWASSTQSGPGWGPCGLCPHMHRRGVPSFARCLGGGGAFLQQREHWPCPGISDRRSSLALTVSMYIAGSAERELGAPFKSQQRNSRLASWRGTLLFLQLWRALQFITVDIRHCVPYFGFPGWVSGKESTCQCRRRRRHGFDPWVGKIP